jgi:hypothetical protein
VQAATLKDKLNRMIAAKTIREIGHAAYIERLKNDEQALQGLSFMIALDYDIALINGFGFTDRSAPGGKTIEYGIYRQGTEKLIAKGTIIPGVRPDLDLVKDITAKKTARTDMLQLVWTVEATRLQAANVAGFNIYRNSERLNRTPVMSAIDKTLSQFTWFDSSAMVTQKVSYTVAPVTMFGIEGKGKSFEHDPTLFPTEYLQAEVTDIKPLREDYTTGVRVAWDFPKESQHFLKGFMVYKSNMPAGYEPISGMISSSSRNFTDVSPSPMGSYIKYQVKAVYKDEIVTGSGEKIFYYFPVARPPKPTNVRGRWQKKEGKFFVNLDWDGRSAGDTLTAYYQLYASSPVNDVFYLQSGVPPIRSSHYSYELYYGESVRYRFAVAGVSKHGVESELSDTITVSAPSLRLPFPVLTHLTLDSNRVRIRWSFPKIWDLKGFRIFQNGNMVASEYQIGKGTREFTTPPLKWKTYYRFTIQAVTDNGVESGKSVDQTIFIEPAKK